MQTTAVIPVAGMGTRLRPLTYTQPKPLIPVAGKPILGYIVDDLIETGVDRFVFVIGYLGDKIKIYIEEHYPDIEREFTVQSKREGLGHAVWTARDAFRDAPNVIIVLGDTIFDAEVQSIVDSETSCLAVKEVKDPRDFGVVELDEEDRVVKLVEKPNIPKSNLAMVGMYNIHEVDELIEALENNIHNDRRTHGEIQLTDALQQMIDQGVAFTTHRVNNWFDCGKKEILLETNAILLARGTYSDEDFSPYEDSIIIPPVYIHPSAEIRHSIVGPNVSIGASAQIDASIVKHSIIGEFASIQEVVLQASIVGNDASIKGLRQSLNIGDNTEIDFR